MVNKEVLEYVKESFDLKDKGFYKPAIEKLYKALSIECENVEILSQLAELYYLLKNNKRAISYIEKTLEVDEKNINCLNLMKLIYLNEGNYAQALVAANKIYDIDKSAENFSEKLNILCKMNDFETIENLQSDEFDNNEMVLFSLAEAFFKNSKFDKANEYANKILAINPDNQANILLLVEISFAENKLELAKEFFDKLKNKEENPIIMNYYGLFLIEESKHEEAIKCFQKAIKMDDRNSKYAYNIANAYFLNGWMSEAAKFFNTAICLEPENIDYHYGLAYFYYENNEYDRAMSKVSEVLSMDSGYLQAKVLKSLINAKKGDPVLAKVELDKIVKENPENNFAIISLAKVCVELAQFDVAKTYIEKALEFKPDSPDYLSDYAEILINIGDNEEAKKVIEKLLAINSKFVPALVLQAKYYYELKEYESVFEVAQKIIDLDSNYSEGYFYNALALFEQGDVHFAVETMKKAISLDVNKASYYVTMSEFYQRLGQAENALAYVKEASNIDNSAKNRELYANLASIVRKSRQI